MTRKTPFVASPERTALLRELKKLQPGEQINFATLNQRVGFDVSKTVAILRGVRETIEAQGGGTIDLYKGVLRRLPDSEVVNVKSDMYRRKARHAASRGVRALAGANYTALSDADKREHNMQMSALGAIKLVTSMKARNEIAKGVEATKAALPAESMLNLFKTVK